MNSDTKFIDSIDRKTTTSSPVLKNSVLKASMSAMTGENAQPIGVPDDY